MWSIFYWLPVGKPSPRVNPAALNQWQFHTCNDLLYCIVLLLLSLLLVVQKQKDEVQSLLLMGLPTTCHSLHLNMLRTKEGNCKIKQKFEMKTLCCPRDAVKISMERNEVNSCRSTVSTMVQKRTEQNYIPLFLIPFLTVWQIWCLSMHPPGNI